MARQLRLEYEGAIYHVMSRGDRGERIYLDEEDRRRFLAVLEEACGRAQWAVHAYCLMSNHFHLVVETPQPTLVAGMKWMLGTYTQRFNARHRLRGHLFAGRYKSLLVDGSDDFYLRTVCDYVHLNPARARLLGEGGSLESYPWSSYVEYLKDPSLRKPWVRVDRLLGELGLEDNAKGQMAYAAYLQERIAGENKEVEALHGRIRRGWRLGGNDFLERLEEAVGKSQPHNGAHFSQEILETMDMKGTRIIAEELRKRELEMEDLKKMPKMSLVKAEIAKRLRKETTLTLKWIAEHLNSGTAGTVGMMLLRLKP